MNIVIVNKSSVMPDTEVSAICDALQIQVSRDFAPAWGVDAKLRFVGSSGVIDKAAWVLAVLDTSDQANALGYHDVTPYGLPLGKAFAKSDIDNGYQPSVTISHELLEMLVDPEINLCAQVGQRLYAYEVCDPCEADALGYKINGVAVSNFILPSWFAPGTRHRGPYDFGKKLKKPLSLAAGGYLQYLDLGSSAGWQQVTADKPSLASRAKVGSRRERRGLLRDHWLLSTYGG